MNTTTQAVQSSPAHFEADSAGEYPKTKPCKLVKLLRDEQLPPLPSCQGSFVIEKKQTGSEREYCGSDCRKAYNRIEQAKLRSVARQLLAEAHSV